MSEEYVEKIHEVQGKLAISFMDALSSNNKELFLDCLSEQDKAYLRGAYKMLKAIEEESISFEEWLSECVHATKIQFSSFIDNYGVSDMVRYENKLIANVILPKNIETTIVSLTEQEMVVAKIPLILETFLTEGNEIAARWKVYFFSNEEVIAPI